MPKCANKNIIKTKKKRIPKASRVIVLIEIKLLPCVFFYGDETPEQWSLINILPIPKSGDFSLGGNYRGISHSSLAVSLQQDDT